MDDKGDAYCILPYTGDDDGMFPVKANKDYILFSEKFANKDEHCDEYVMTCDKPIEQDLVYIIFSPKKFVKAMDNESKTTVKVGNETLKLPRQLSFRDFQKWLLNCRRVDSDMQVVIEPISITRE